jgi:hypothetical protein
VINIYPLETLNLVTKNHVSEVPNSNDVRKMLDFVRLKASADKRLETLVYNIFSKVVMVKEYSRAMDIAKDFKLTCVTPDL